MFPCMVSGGNQLQDIDQLLLNAPATRGVTLSEVAIDTIRQTLTTVVRDELKAKDHKDLHRFRFLRAELRGMMSQADEQFAALMQTVTDEAKDGPRLFSFVPVDPGFFSKPRWISEAFRLTLWCEHARLPLPALTDDDSTGVYTIELTREWVSKAAPLLRFLTTTLSIVLPVAASATKLLMDDVAYKAIENELNAGQKTLDAMVKVGQKAVERMRLNDTPDWEERGTIRAEGGTLRALQVLLQKKDPTFGGLVRVQNKQREFLWVHSQFVGEY